MWDRQQRVIKRWRILGADISRRTGTGISVSWCGRVETARSLKIQAGSVHKAAAKDILRHDIVLCQPGANTLRAVHRAPTPHKFPLRCFIKPTIRFAVQQPAGVDCDHGGGVGTSHYGIPWTRTRRCVHENQVWLHTPLAVRPIFDIVAIICDHMEFAVSSLPALQRLQMSQKFPNLLPTQTDWFQPLRCRIACRDKMGEVKFR